MSKILLRDFFSREPLVVAPALLGKVIRRKYGRHWLSARIIETEAYYLREKGSHSSLGRTPSREPTFMRAGTIYMYFARGGPSLNISCEGEGNAVLIKSGHPYFDGKSPGATLRIMQKLNPPKNGKGVRAVEKICAGQTLLCRALGLQVRDWTGKDFSKDEFFMEDVGAEPAKIIQARRLGIPLGRDEHLPYRFVDAAFARFATKNPLTQRDFARPT